MSKKTIREKQVLSALKRVIDPELGFNIVDLGLVYGVVIKNEEVVVRLTLTSPGCPLGSFIAEKVKEELKTGLMVKKVKVEITFDPPWSPQKMAPELKALFGW